MKGLAESKNVLTLVFASLVERKTFSDVILECDGRSFQCHKNVLAAWSDVFLAMFSRKDMVEGHTGKVINEIY